MQVFIVDGLSHYVTTPISSHLQIEIYLTVTFHYFMYPQKTSFWGYTQKNSAYALLGIQLNEILV